MHDNPLLRRTFRGLSRLALGYGLLCAAGCGGERPMNVLLVTLDTTRADHLGCYGNDTVRTPNIDRLAAQGVRFAQAVSAAPITMPSHTTILTGKYPLGHGVRDNGLFVLGEEEDTLAEIVSRQGWSTAAAIGGFPLVARFGLPQGFDLYDDTLRRKDDDPLGRRRKGPSLYFEERRAALVAEALFPWLENAAHRPFFAWLHFYDPHQPFDPPEPYAQLYVDDPYLGEIAYADEIFGRVLAELERLGEAQRTIVVLTSDHGEGRTEHNELTHSFLNYQTTQHVPLVIRAPGGAAGAVIDRRVGSVDIAPTILDLLGLEVPAAMQGRSLADEVRSGRSSAREAPYYAETLSPRLSHGWGEIRTLYADGWKYIHGPRPELYHVDEDEHEIHDLAAAEPERAAAMKERLQTIIDRYSQGATSIASPVDEDTRAKLEALGYLSAGGSGETIQEVLTSEGLAPQDFIEDVSLLSQIRSALSRGQALAALRDIERLLEKDPDNLFVLETGARAQMALGRFAEAQEFLDRVIALGRTGTAITELQAQIGLQKYLAGEREAGLERLRQAVDFGASAEAYYSLALVLRELGLAGFEEALEGALSVDPTYSPARTELAIRKAIDGETQEAESLFRQALADQPYFAKGHYNFGAFLLEQQRPAEAADRFHRATQLEPGYAEAYYGEIVAQLTEGRREAGEETYGRLREAAPESPWVESAAQLLGASP